MAGSACVVFDPSLTDYDFGPMHPLDPVRVDLTMRLARAMGVLNAGRLVQVDAPVAPDDLIATVHSDAYMDAVMRMGEDPYRSEPEYGIGTPDTPAFAGMHAASAHIVGASVEAARRVWEGETLHAANIAGGLHHAMPDSASGFCVYNDPAIAIRWLLAQGAERVAYVDVDAHHGDGVQTAFYDDPRVLTLSIHETPETMFPGTGFPTETGRGGGVGKAVNVALPPGTSDAGWLRAFHAIVPPLLNEFDPQVMVTQHGCDSHVDDPLTHLMLTVDGQRAAHLALHELAHQVCAGKWVALGGGGYSIVDVVPRTWTHLLSIVGGHPIDPGATVDGGWREHVRALTGGHAAPTQMTDGRAPEFKDWSMGYDPASWLDRSIQATREAIFPPNGLDAHY
ncbi:MAG TPA: acetoin utilization protein AcuC [Nocardioidaceae bacterium]|nr:acetoin utilization protein AcuC [Nocardioidaceae bacterium]